MKRIIIAIFIYFFLPLFGYCDDGLIWNYQNDDFMESTEESNPKKNAQRQEKLDNAIRQALDINLLPVNLEDCVTIALKNSSTLKIAKSNQLATKWEFANSLSFLAPDMYYRYQIQDVRGEFLVGGILPVRIDTNPVYSGFTFEYPILSDPHALFQSASRKNLYDAAGHRVNYTREEIILKTTLNYYDLLQAKMDIEVLIVNLRERQEQLRLMIARKQIGVGTKFDVLRAESELAKAKQELITALNSLRLKQANLADIMGIDVTTTVYPIETNIQRYQLIESKYDIDGLYKIALTLREDIKAKNKEIRSLSYLKNMNYADFAPQIYLSYEYGRASTLQANGGLRPNHTWSLNVIVPMGKNCGVKTMTQAKADAARLRSAELELRSLKGDVKQYILNSYYNSRSATEKIEASKKEVAATDEGLKYALVGFDVGNNNFLDIIDAQKNKTLAHQLLIKSTIEYNKAQVQLLFDTGIISPKTLLSSYKAPSVLHQKYKYEE